MSDDDVVMQVSAEKFVLQSMFDKASKVVPNKNLMPVLKNFYVEASAGRLRVASTDLELSLVVNAQLVQVDSSGTVVLPSRKVLEIMSAGADELCSISVEGTQCTIQIGKARWALTLMQDASAYPPLPEIDDVELVPVERVEFLEALSMVYKAAGRTTARQNLMLLNVEGGKITGTDGARCQQVLMPSWPTDLLMQIPIGAVDELIRLLRSTEAEQIEVGASEDHLIFMIGQDMFVANVVLMEFPDIEQQLIVPALANDQELVCDREELMDVVRRVRITTDPQTSAIQMQMDEDVLTLRSADKYQNVAEETMDCRWEHPAKSIAVNHTFLMDMLDMADAKSCAFFLSGTDTMSKPSPLLLRDDSKEMVGIVSQMRQDWAGG